MKKFIALLIFLFPFANAIHFGIHCDGVELIEEIGVENFVNACYEKGYDAILINVMPWKYYFESPTLENLGWEFGGDLLKPLIQEAHSKGIKVFADVQTLAWKVREDYNNPGRKPTKEDVANIVLELIEYGVDGISEELFPAEWMEEVYMICNEHNVTYIHKHIPFDVVFFYFDESTAFEAYSNCNIIMTEDYYMNDDLARNEMSAGFCNSLNKELWIKSCPEDWALGSINDMENVLAMRALQYNPNYIFAMIYEKEDFEEFEPHIMEEIIDNFSYAEKEKVLNVIVYIGDEKEDLDAWELFDINYAFIANSAGASGYKVYITNEPMKNADAYFIYTRGRVNDTLHLPSSILSLFNQSNKLVFLEVANDLPNDEEWREIRKKFGIDESKEFWSIFGMKRIKAKYNGIEYYHLSNEWYLFNNIEPEDVKGNVLSYGEINGTTYAFIIKKDNFIFINGAGLDAQVSFPISNLLNDALQSPFDGVCSVAKTSCFYAYNDSFLEIRFPYDVKEIELMKRDIFGNIKQEKIKYGGKFEYQMKKGDLLILKLIGNVSIHILRPRNHLYINDREIMALRKTIVFGKITIEVETTADYIEIYINDELKYRGEENKWLFDEKAFGMYEIKAVAYCAEDKVRAFICNLA